MALSYVEDYDMGMKLWRSISIDGPGSVVLKCCGDEFPGRLRRVYVSNPGLRVSLEFLKRHSNTLAVGFPDPIIASHKRGERY